MKFSGLLWIERKGLVKRSQMDIRKKNFFDTHLNMMNKEPFDHIAYRNMALFFSSCWFYFIKFVLFLIKFAGRHVFRIKMEDSSQKSIKDCFVPIVSKLEADEIEERGFDGFGEREEEEKEEEHSSFSFKFEYQIPMVSSVSNEEPSISDKEESLHARTTSISNYRFVSDRDFSGFVEEPEAVTFQVHESFIDGGGDEKLESEVLSARDFEKPSMQLATLGFLKDQKLERKRPIGLRSSSFDTKRFSHFESDSAGNSDCRIQSQNMMFMKGEKSEGRIPIVSRINSVGKKEVEEKFSGSDSNSAGDIQESRMQTEGVISLEGKSSIASNSTSSSERESICSFSGFNSDFAGDCENPSMQSQDVTFLKDQNLESASSDQDDVVDSLTGFGSDGKGDFVEHVTQSHTEMLPKDQILKGRGPFSFDPSSDSDSDSESLSDGYSVKNLVVDSDSDGFLSDKDFVDKESLIDSSTFEMELMEDIEKIEGGEASNFENVFNDGFLSERCFSGPERISDEKLHELESFIAENRSPYTDKLSQLDEVWSENESLEAELAELELRELDVEEIDKTRLASSSKVQIEFMDSSDDELHYAKHDSNVSEHSNLEEPAPVHAELDTSDTRLSQTDEVLARNAEGCKKETVEEKSQETEVKNFDDEELDELESLWEHQDLIEQLKMELKRVRAFGLPTIFEESETPKTIDDLKPWKIEDTFLPEDPMDELHKFYKTYRERMRKFDILNYQKMYAIGFLQLKDPLESMGTQKPLISTLLSHFSHNLRPLYRRKSITDPSEKFMKEVQVDLETVYVGQTCLSWEFLRWQYEKARELPESDPYWSRQYNQVAGEFQQFQVLVQRFIENESFQGPRLQNYVKNRCVLRNLLQVPLIKEDCSKDRMEEKRKRNYAITSDMLEDIMVESIRLFWEFVKADKDETSVILKGLIGNHVELQDPSDFELMSEVQASLQKKEKKLKDLLKTGNCLVKKLKKPREDRSNQDLFFSQVDMKLVSRVLKMSRLTTDQLVWCHMKLSKITFSDRKIHREPSFLLFPC